jgi:hypothetical protein
VKSAPELAGQLQSGTPMSERECFHRALYHLNGLKACMSGLANSRKDMRWLIPVRICNQIEDSIKKLIDRGGPRVVWLPGMPDSWRQ